MFSLPFFRDARPAESLIVTLCMHSTQAKAFFRKELFLSYGTQDPLDASSDPLQFAISLQRLIDSLALFGLAKKDQDVYLSAHDIVSKSRLVTAERDVCYSPSVVYEFLESFDCIGLSGRRDDSSAAIEPRGISIDAVHPEAIHQHDHLYYSLCLRF